MALRVSVVLLKLLGGFPYCEEQRRVQVSSGDYLSDWDHHLLEDETTTGQQPHHHHYHHHRYQGTQCDGTFYRKSKIWQCWSWFVVATLVTYSVIYLMWFIDTDSYNSSNNHTKFTAITTCTWVSHASFAFTEGYLLIRSSMAMRVVTELKVLIQRLHLTPKRMYQDSWFLLVAAVLVGVYYPAFVYSFFRFTDMHDLLAYREMYKMVGYFMTYCFVLNFFYWTIRLLCGVYVDIKKCLLVQFSREKEAKQKVEVIGSSASVNISHIPEFKNISQDTTRTTRTTRRTVQSSSLMTRKEHLGDVGRHLIWEEMSRSAVRKLLRLHCVHRLVMDYLGLPVFLIMTVSVVYCIVSCFCLLANRQLEEEMGMEMMLVCYMIWTLLSMSTLTSIPDILLSQVRGCFHSNGC